MNLGYAVSAVFSILILIITEGDIRRSILKELVDIKFIKLIHWMYIFCTFDVFWGLFYVGAFKSQIGFTIACYGVYFMAGVVTLFWFNYMIDFIGAGPNMYYVLKTVSAALLIMQVLLLITNEFTHQIFFVNSESVYFSGFGRIQLQTLQALNFAVILLYGIIKIPVIKNPIYRKKILVGMLFSVIPALFGFGQVFLIDVAMFSLGFAISIYIMFMMDKSKRILNQIDKNHRQERDEQLSIINSLAGNFSTIYSVDIATGGFLIYNRNEGESFLNKVDNSNLDYFKVALEKGRKMVHEDDLITFLFVMDRDFIINRLNVEDFFSVTLRIYFGQSVKYIEYRFSKSIQAEGNRILIGVYDIDKSYRKQLKEQNALKNARRRQMELEEEAQVLEKAALRDIMTGLYNRRAYEEFVEENKGMPDGEDFVYVSLDINGLKAINDDLGHEAGDELIKGTAFCLKKTLGHFGLIYRHGGDEFSAILHASNDEVEKIFAKLDREVAAYKGTYIDGITVSYGYISVGEAESLLSKDGGKATITIEEMSKIADERMYEAKNRFYSKKGVDRRGQQEAYDAIRKSYIKILKVDLASDSFVNLYVESHDDDSFEKYDGSISAWINDFAATGQVHPDDVEDFTRKLTIDEVRSHFEKRLDNIVIHYRRKSQGGYNNALLEIIPSEKFSPQSQIVFLYVKNIY